MKTRQGFVSNSSSTSFCIYGTQLDFDKWNAISNAESFVRLLKKIKQEFPTDYDKCLEEIKQEKNPEYYGKQLDVAERITEIKISDGPELLYEDDEEDGYFELVHDFIGFFGLGYFYVPDLEGIWVGRSWSAIDDNETGLKFKTQIEEIVGSLFGEKCGTYEEAWYS
jgi:hypothetical protein